MKSDDQKALEEAYMQVVQPQPVPEPQQAEQPEAPEQVQEGLKGALAAAAMGLGTLTGAQGADDKHMTHDDYADKVSIEDASKPAQPTLWQAYDKVVELVKSSSKEIPDELLEIISKDKEMTKKLAHFFALRGYETPEILKKHVGDYSKELQHAFKGA